MKHFIYLLIVFLLTFSSQLAMAQVKGKIIDGETGEAVPYASIWVRGTNNGTYSNEEGYFQLNFDENDTLQVQHLGYKKQLLTLTKQKASPLIALQKQTNQLNEVMVEAERGKTRTNKEKTGSFFSKKNVYVSYKVPNGTTIACLLPNSFALTGKISKLYFKVKNHKGEVCRIRIHVYENEGGKPGRELLTSTIIRDVSFRISKLTIELDQFNILLPKEGVFIGMEFMGDITKDGSLNMDAGFQNLKIAFSRNDEQAHTFIRPPFKEFTIYPFPFAQNNTPSNAMFGAEILY